MSNVLYILSELKKSEVSLSLDETGFNLKLRGNVTSLTNETKNILKLNKESLIEFLREDSTSYIVPTLKSHNTSDIFSLSPNQKRIWFHEKIEDLGTAYIIPAIYFYELKDFNEAIFHQALTFLVEDNDVFRLVFGEKDGEPYQQLKENIDVKYHYDFVKVSDVVALKKQISVKNNCVFSSEGSLVWDITVYKLPESSYCFCLRLHHLIGDGESLSLFIQKLIATYTQLQNGVSLIQKEHLQYRDYVSWISQKENFERSSAFWKKEFLNYEENFQLSTDKESNINTEQSGRTYTFEFSESRAVSMRNWAVSNRVSLASLYTAATGIVLSKRGNCHDFVVGIPTASRNHPQLTEVIGNLVNTLPLRLNIDYSIDQKAYVQEIQNRYLAILEHQIYPFQYILEDISFQRKANEHPLFNVMISIPNNVTEKASENQIELERITSLYDLTFTFIECEKNIQLALEYVTSKFELETIERIAREIDIVFEQLLSEFTYQLSSIVLISQNEQEDTFSSLNQSLSTYTVLDYLKVQVDERPNQIAIVSRNSQLSYLEFYNSIVDLATYLKIEKGLEPNSNVTVVLERSIDQLITMYAIWLVGGTYVPIDLSLPNERKALIIEDCESEIVIDIQFITLFKQATLNPIEFSKVPPTAIAYILYTSGTTGKPKGVMISHQNLENKIQEETELLKVTEDTITYTLTNSSFDVSFLETVLPLSQGGKVIIAQEKELKDTEEAIRSIIANEVTHLQGTPTYFSHFVSLLTEESGQKLFQYLNYICIGGESLNGYLVQQLKSKLPNTQINNHYGPTEITIDALVKEDISIFTKNSIGKIIGNTKAYVVDEFGNLLSKGVVGELVIGGPSVFSGYWKDEVLTKSKLRALNFTEGVFYKTGDLAKLNSEGEFEFIGRKDKQVKLRGYRIELDDINQTLMSIQGLHQAVSQVIDNVLVSWVVSNVDENFLKEQLRQQLPEHMIPQSIEIVNNFPMTDNGKIDIINLPKHKKVISKYVAPRTAMEEKIAFIWQKVLEKEAIGVYDNFFELGGHSLKAIQILARIQDEFGSNIELRELFVNPTIEHIAKQLEIGNFLRDQQINFMDESRETLIIDL